MLLNFKQIEFFHAVMETKTVSHAAELLNVSQPSVSRMIKYAEYRLGIQLFERKKNRLLPTPEAIRLYKEIQLIYKQLRILDESLKMLAQGGNSVFRVGSSPSLARYVVPRLFRNLREELNNLPLKLDVLSVDQAVDYLTHNQGELLITIYPLEHPVIESKEIMHGRLMCVLPKNHPLATETSVKIEDLIDQPLVGFDSTTPHGKIIKELFSKIDKHPVISVRIRFAETACAMVEQNLGIALVDEFTVMGEAQPGFTVVPVETPSPFSIYLHFNNTIARSKISRKFESELELLKTQLK